SVWLANSSRILSSIDVVIAGFRRSIVLEARVARAGSPRKRALPAGPDRTSASEQTGSREGNARGRGRGDKEENPYYRIHIILIHLILSGARLEGWNLAYSIRLLGCSEDSVRGARRSS